jgi:hypothetical protein
LAAIGVTVSESATSSFDFGLGCYVGGILELVKNVAENIYGEVKNAYRTDFVARRLHFSVLECGAPCIDIVHGTKLSISGVISDSGISCFANFPLLISLSCL